MPKTREQYQEIKDERRANILKASLRLFAVRGYDATTINDITTASNCSHGLFYHYFSSKEEVFKTLIEASADREKMSRSGMQLDRTDISPLEALKTGLEYIVTNLLDPTSDFPYYFYIFLNIHFQKTLPAPPQKKAGMPRTNPFAAVTNFIKRGQDCGEFEPGDPKELAVIFFSLLRGLTYVRLMSPDNFRLPSSTTILNLFLRKEKH